MTNCDKCDIIYLVDRKGIEYMKFNAKQVGERVRELRKSRNMTQDALSEKIGISLKHWGAFERGTSGISIQNYIKVADYFGVTLDYLICGKMDDECKISMKKYGERLKKLSPNKYSEFDKIMDIVLKGLGV